MKRTKSVFFIGILILGIAVMLFRNCRTGDTPEKGHPGKKEESGTTKSSRGLDREPAAMNYSKHAKCRMDCRHISESEVKDILRNGTINYKKSDLKTAECSKKYAVEGFSKDRQHLRIIFAPCNAEVTVVTCIDLEKEWECGDCG